MINPKTLEHREYQAAIAASCMKENTLVVLPTGLGKTAVAALVIAETLGKDKGKILFMAPTKPLVEQHASFLKRVVKDANPAVLTGEVSPMKRVKIWEESQIIVSTPQVISNDLISGRISLSDVSLIIFDEAHRAVGKYAYVFVAEKYLVQGGGRVLGMTASPGNEETTLEVCSNLGITAVEIRSESDPDVAPYVHKIKFQWVRVDLPEGTKKLVEMLRTLFNQSLKELRAMGMLQGFNRVPGKREILELGRQIQMRMKMPGQTPSNLYRAMSLQAALLKIETAIDIAETQNITAVKNYLDRLMQEANSRTGSKAAREIVSSILFRDIVKYLGTLDYEHPKLNRLIEIVRNEVEKRPNSRIIVFTNIRDTCDLVVDSLGKEGIHAERFVGQASRGGVKGLKQREQVEIIERFKNGEFPVLVATSVAEEGLDIPATDLVIFYEPVPSVIRTIQRRGRTGRQQSGRVIILITRKTRDEGYYWSVKRQEKQMKEDMIRLREALAKRIVVPEHPAGESSIELPEPDLPEDSDMSERKNPTLFDFSGKKPEKKEPMRILVDTREFRSEVVTALARYGVVVESRQMDAGDYIISERVVVERKEAQDFISSLMDGRLFQQMGSLKSAYPRPVVIIEGESLYGIRNISKEAINGALASIVIDFGIPVLFTGNAEETADMLVSMLKRENSEGHVVRLRGKRAGFEIHEQMQYIIEGLPGVSGVLARRLLSHFGTIQAIANASVDELMEVNGIGKATAQGIYDIFRERYLAEERKS